MRPALTLIISLSLFFPGLVISQTSERRDPGIPMNYNPSKWFAANIPKQIGYFQRLPGISPDYRMGPRDVLRIDVTGMAGLNQNFRISNSGNINFSPLGDIHAADLTAEELETEISMRLKNQGLLKNPEVLVYIESYEAKPIYVVGEVDNPGEYIMSQHMTLMDAIFVAGGLDFTASRYGFLHRRILPGKEAEFVKAQEPIGKRPIFNIWMDGNAPQAGIMKNPEIAAPGTEVIKIDLEPLKAGGLLEPDIPLRAGDVFVVPRRNVQFFYVVGEVVNPGAYEVQPRMSLLASQAISYAGGPAKTAKTSEGMLVRYDENGSRRESQVDYAAILKGKQKDFAVLPNDIIFIPGSNAKTLGYGLLGIVPETFRITVTD
ncbi:MAG: polysaccharide biosynthesis/export family protein [Acidobacteria bacterium]|nr:polysaccharide biosynthesis/export family protein [Acidobacteriota bacterium]